MRYAKYKTTGIAWLPEVPEEWAKVRFWNTVRFKKDRDHVTEPMLSVYLDRGVVYTADTDGKQVHKPPEDLSDYQLVLPGDFVMNNQQCWRGSVGVSQLRGIISPAYFVFELSKEYYWPRFADYYLRDRYMVTQYRMASKGVGSIQQILCFPWFKATYSFLPRLEVQRHIASYLDEKCGKIDALVAVKEKEATLLKELKQSMIAEAVTGATKVARTDTARKMKPSGIPWLPEVPEGWEVKRVATLLKIKDCPSAPNEELLSVFLDRGVIRFSDGGEKRANATSKDLSKYQLVEVDDFVMNNQQAWRGSVGMSRYRGIVSPAYFVVRMADCIDSKYAEYAFRSRSFVSVYELCSRGVGSIQRNLIWNMFKQQHLPVPPLAEQRAIVAYIEARAAKIDAAVKGLEREVAVLKEYRERLIADVVTGQRKVA